MQVGRMTPETLRLHSQGHGVHPGEAAEEPEAVAPGHVLNSGGLTMEGLEKAFWEQNVITLEI